MPSSPSSSHHRRSLSSSSSSSSRDSDSDDSDSSDSSAPSLTASGWDRFKSHRPVVGRPLLVLSSSSSVVEGGVGDANADAERRRRSSSAENNSNERRQRADDGDGAAAHRHLLSKRHYDPSPTTVAATDAAPAEEGSSKNDDDATKKTELECAVLHDCLSRHFVCSHLRPDDVTDLVNRRFTKVRYRNHEVIYDRGDDAKYLYVLYSGDVTRRRDGGGSIVSDGNSEEDDDKYTVLGELAVLTGRPHVETAIAASTPTILFRLDSTTFHATLRRLPSGGKQRPYDGGDNDATQISAAERLSLLQRSLPEELTGHFTPVELSNLVSAMTVASFRKGDVLVDKSTKLDSLVLVARGSVTSTDVTMGGRSYDDVTFGDGAEGQSEAPNKGVGFGWQAVLGAAGGDEEVGRQSIDGDGDGDGHDDGPSATFRGTLVAQSDGIALLLSRDAFGNVLLNQREQRRRRRGEDDGASSTTTTRSRSMMQHLADRRLARIQLKQVPLFDDSALDDEQVHGLLDLMHRCEYDAPTADGPPPPNDGATTDEDADDLDEERTVTMFRAGDKVEAAMYFVRHGAVTLELNKGHDRKTISAGGYFGEQNMLRDQHKTGKKHYVIRSPMTALAHGPRTVVDVLYLEECRSIVDTTRLGLGRRDDTGGGNVDSSISWDSVDRHVLLGTGSFGQVWLASLPERLDDDGVRTDDDDDDAPLPCDEEKKTSTEAPTVTAASTATATKRERRIVALKVQAKHRIVEAEKADRVVAERNILASLHSPFLLRLVHAYQDDMRLYMITPLLQGGELESIIPDDDGLSERAAKFYAGGILEGLVHMHRRRIVHRDIKPSNVLIDERGYPVLIDFGFAKYVPDKTYTFCGSPLFTAPEIIKFQGHDRGCDNWAWAVLLYKMVTGKYPFFEKGGDELKLYKRICKGTLELDGHMSVEFRTLMVGLLYPDPSHRLGSRRNGWQDIFDSPWFASDASFDLRRLRSRDMPAPWVPNLNDPLDASRFHPTDASTVEDLIDQTLPTVDEKNQMIFHSFGPNINKS